MVLGALGRQQTQFYFSGLTLNSHVLQNLRLLGLATAFAGCAPTAQVQQVAVIRGRVHLRGCPAQAVMVGLLAVKMDNLTDQHYWIGYGSMNPQKLRSIIGSVAFRF